MVFTRMTISPHGDQWLGLIVAKTHLCNNESRSVGVFLLTIGNCTKKHRFRHLYNSESCCVSVFPLNWQERLLEEFVPLHMRLYRGVEGLTTLHASAFQFIICETLGLPYLYAATYWLIACV